MFYVTLCWLNLSVVFHFRLQLSDKKMSVTLRGESGNTPMESAVKTFGCHQRFMSLTRVGTNVYAVMFKLCSKDGGVPFEMTDAIGLPVFLTNNPGYIISLVTVCSILLICALVIGNLGIVRGICSITGSSSWTTTSTRKKVKNGHEYLALCARIPVKLCEWTLLLCVQCVIKVTATSRRSAKYANLCFSKVCCDRTFSLAKSPCRSL